MKKITVDLFYIDRQGNEILDKRLELDVSKIKHFKYCIANHYSDYKKLDENTKEILRNFAELKGSLK